MHKLLLNLFCRCFINFTIVCQLDLNIANKLFFNTYLTQKAKQLLSEKQRKEYIMNKAFGLLFSRYVSIKSVTMCMVLTIGSFLA